MEWIPQLTPCSCHAKYCYVHNGMGTSVHHKVFMRQVRHILVDLTISLSIWFGKPAALMIAYSGMNRYRFHFGILWITSSITPIMVLFSILISSILQKIKFAWFRITMDGIKPKKMTEAILQFATSTNLTSIRSWFELVNQVSYTFSQDEITSPFRELLQTENWKFDWDNMLNRMFETLKKVFVQEIEDVKSFEVNRPTCLSTDYNRIGVGYFLFQKYCRCPTGIGSNYGKVHWKLVLAGSCVTIEVEFCYAPVEGGFGFGLQVGVMLDVCDGKARFTSFSWP